MALSKVSAAGLESSLDLSGKAISLPTNIAAKLIQRQHFLFTTGQTISSTNFVDVFSANFTPKRADSKIYLSMNLAWGRRENAEMQFGHRFLRGADVITQHLSTTLTTSYDQFRTQADSAMGHGHVLYLGYDTPNTTNQVTYKFQVVKTASGYANVYINFNNIVGSTLIVDEFAP